MATVFLCSQKPHHVRFHMHVSHPFAGNFSLVWTHGSRLALAFVHSDVQLFLHRL